MYLKANSYKIITSPQHLKYCFHAFKPAFLGQVRGYSVTMLRQLNSGTIIANISITAEELSRVRKGKKTITTYRGNI